MTHTPQNKGFVQLIIIIVLAVIILSLLGISISSFIHNTTLRDNFATLWRGISWLWNEYIAGALRPLWDFIRGLFSN